MLYKVLYTYNTIKVRKKRHMNDLYLNLKWIQIYGQQFSIILDVILVLKIHRKTYILFKSVSVDDVTNLIKDLQNNIYDWVYLIEKLKDCIYDIRKYPDYLKFTSIMPVFKKHEPLDKENHRPVRVLPLLSKVFE